MHSKHDEVWPDFVKALEEAIDECVLDGTASEITIQTTTGKMITVGVYVDRDDLNDLDETPSLDGAKIIGGPIVV